MIIPVLFWISFSVFFGACVGSFLNVVIYRLPRDLSVVTPRSFCPSCQKMIPWYQNIPVLSYLVLRGRCASCQAKISMRYPLVESLCGMIAGVIMARAMLSPVQPFWGEAIFYFSIFAAMLAHFLIDIEHQLLPDEINIYLGALFLLNALFKSSYLFWLSGFAIGLLFPLAVATIFYKLRGIHGLGGGDIKLYAALGIFLGPIGILQNIFLSSLLGTLLAGGLILSKKMGREQHIAFGPFIVIVALAQIMLPFFGVPFPSFI